jgi:hypothetical protein
MAVRVTCSACGAVYSLPEQLSGKKVRCKQCQATFVATATEDAPEVERNNEPERREALRTRPDRDPPGRTRDEEPDRRRREEEEEPTGHRKAVFWILVGGGALLLFLFLAGVVGILVLRSHADNDPNFAGFGALLDDDDDNPFAAPPWPQPQPFPNVGPGPIAPPPIAPPPPPLPLQKPKRPAFNDKFARAAKLVNDRFETRGRFDDDDPADRFAEQPVKLFLIELKADEIYVGEMNLQLDAFGEPILRVEDRDGGELARGQRKPGRFDGPASFIFVPTKTDTYRVVASVQPGEGSFSLSLRRVEEGSLLPDVGAPTEKPPAHTIRLARKLDNYLSATIAPDSRSAWVAWPDNRLERFSCPDFASKAVHRLSKRTYRVAVDGRGMLYTAAQVAPVQPGAPRGSDFGPADILVFDTNKLAEEGGVLTPTKTIPVGGVFSSFLVSPDDAWLYYLDTKNLKVGRINLQDGKFEPETLTVGLGTNSLCVTPSGKKLYTCTSNNAVQVIDAATFKIEQAITFQGVRPTGIQATDKGHVFLNSGQGQWTHVYLLYAGRDYKGAPADVVPWAGVYQTNALALSRDQTHLYASCFNLSPSNITVFHVPARPTLGKGVQCGVMGLDRGATQGQMVVSPDGKFLFCDCGLILTLGQ